VNRYFINTLVLACLFSGVVSAASITLQVYQVCDDAGANCASTGPGGDVFFSAATNKIWAQAGITVDYHFAGQLNSTNFSAIDDNVLGRRFYDLAATTADFQSATVADVFLVHTIAGAYGEGWFGSGGFVLGMDTIMAYAAGGRIDTMGHELGHNLGLDNAADPDYDSANHDGHSGNLNQLMASGGIRHVPTTIGDINPDGFGYDQLTAYQIGISLQSSLLTPDSAVPEPGGMVLFGSGLLAIVLGRSRSARTLL
jgi:PEP-CTERM motif